MGGDAEYIFFNFSSDATLKTKSNMLSLINEILKTSEFKLAAAFEDVLEKRAVNNVHEVLDWVWDEASAEDRTGISLDFWNPDGFYLTVAIDRTSFRQLVIVVNNGYISDLTPLDYKNVRSLVQVCELVYTVLHPMYGCGLTTPNVHPIPDPDWGDVNIRAVYDYNFLGPQLVQALSREKVLSAPTWRTMQFDDGGVLLEMSPNPIADWEPYTSNYQKTAEILGIGKYYQGG